MISNMKDMKDFYANCWVDLTHTSATQKMIEKNRPHCQLVGG
jgi:hypothetical protein